MNWRRCVSAILIAAQAVMLMPTVAYGEVVFEEESSSVAMIGPQGGELRLGAALVVVPEGALEKETRVKIKKVREVARTDGLLYNVTRGGGGYRLEPAGLQLKEKAVVSLPYDERVYELDGGVEGLRTYYYDWQKKRWEDLERLGYDRGSGVVESVIAQFSDIINGTLSLPENTGPVEVNINSIKGLEAADPSSGVPRIEGLEGNSEGSASFRIAVGVPAGRAGMTPAVAITYSSGGGTGIMGKGFDIQYGGQIAIDTRWGAARYGEKQGGSDRYVKDGVLLEKTNPASSGEETEYRELRETAQSRIIHLKEGNYWEVTEADGRKKTYGKSGYSWAGVNAEKKNAWNLERETDVYGNTIVYKYDKTGTGEERSFVYPSKILYTGYGEKEGAYRIEFEYEDREDQRLDGRGGYVQAIRRRLSKIAVYGAEGQMLREYRFEYEAGIAKESFVSAVVGCDGDGKEEWRYGFEYIQIGKRSTGELDYFAEPVAWGNAPLSVMRSSQGGMESSMGGGVGIGQPPIGSNDARVSGGARIANGSGESYSEYTMADVNGDGVADVVWQQGDTLYVRLNTVTGLGGEMQAVNLAGLGEAALEQEKSRNFSYGGNVFVGAGTPKGGIGPSISKTVQNGTSRLMCSLLDVDGDGRPDVVMSGKNYYYKNTSSGGKISFVRKDISAGQAVSVTIVLEEKDREKYSEQYYQQRPLRMWKAPYDGRIGLEQTVVKGRGAGSVATHVYNKDGVIGNAGTQISGTGTKTTQTGGIEVSGRDELYYIHDIEGKGWDDIRDNDIQWNIKAWYTRVRPWYRQDELIRYTVPEEGTNVPATIRDKLYNYEYQLISNWPAIVKEDNNNELRQALFDNGYYIPLTVGRDDFESFLRSITVEETAREAAALYAYDAAQQVYRQRWFGSVTPEDQRKAEEGLRLAMDGRQAAYVSNMRVNDIEPQSKTGRVRYRQETTNAATGGGVRDSGYAGSVLDRGKTIYLGTFEGRAIYIREEEGKWYYYDQGRRDYRVEYEKLSNACNVRVYLGSGNDYEAELGFKFSSVEGWPTYITGDEMEALAVDADFTPADFLREPYRPDYWTGKSKSSLEGWLNDRIAQGAITATQREALLGCYTLVNGGSTILLNDGKAAEARSYLVIMERADYLMFMRPYYAPDGTGGYAFQTESDHLADYISKIVDAYKLIKYRTVDIEIVYNPEYLYGVTEYGSRRAFSYTALEGIALVTRRSSMQLWWDSEKEYSTVNEADARQITTTAGAAVTVNSEDILYGGHGGWYYGIWMGGERDNPFSREKLYALMKKAQEEGKKAQEQGFDGDVDKYLTDHDVEKEPSNEWKGYYLVKTGSAAHGELGELVKEVSPGEDYPASHGNNKPLNDGRLLVGNVTICVEQSYRWTGTGREVESIPVCYFPYIDGDILHTNRVGGVSYYELPGIVSVSAGATATAEMVDLRSSRSDGNDWAYTLGILSVSGNYGNNNSTGEMEQNLIDVNGDGIADVVQKSGANAVRVWYGRKGANGEIAYSQEERFANVGALGKHITTMKTYGGGVGGGGSVSLEIKPSGALRSASLTGNAGGSGAYATGGSRQEAGLLDVNGDGLPDYVEKGQVRLGTGGGGYVGGTWISGLPSDISKGETKSTSFAVNYGIGLSGEGNLIIGEKWANTETVNAGIDVGLNASSSSNQSTAMLLDVNGDGLPDYVTKNIASSDYIEVGFNTGTGFLAPVKVFLPGWSTPGAVNSDISERTAATARDMPIVGTPRSINANMDSFQTYHQMNYLDYSATSGWGVSGGINAGGTVHILVPIPVASFVINITLNGSSGINGGDSRTSVTVRMMDMNGDGLPDQVLRVPGVGTYVKLNKGAQAGLLKTIYLPQGGAYRLSYVSSGNTQDMPQHRNVLERVEMDDADHGRGGQHVYVTRYEYRDGYYDREAKEFYGFGSVMTMHADGSTETVQYYNNEYYSKGFEMSRTLRDAQMRPMRRSTQAIDRAPFARPVGGEEFQYGETGLYMRTARELRYDGYGNVTYYSEEGDGVEKIYAQIEYWHNDLKYIHNKPKRITVYDSAGRLLRQRDGSYDENGALTALRQYTDSGKWLQWGYEYDESYGTLSAVQDAAGVRVEYVYDQVLFQYIEQIRHRGRGGNTYYASYIQWDTDRGLKTRETDANGNGIRFEYDKSGRLLTVRTDYDSPDGTAAVRYTYHSEAGKRWYVVTENKIRFDSNDGAVITTVAEADGLGRIRRTAKSGEVWNAGMPAQGWNVSGAAEYDGKGRAIRTGQTYFTAGTAVGTLLAGGINMVNPTVKEYDSLDRVVKITLPDGSASVTRYDVTRLDGVFRSMTEMTDPLGNRNAEYGDARGQTRRTERRDKNNALLTHARYEYNGIGEMLRALDAAGNPLTLTYDLMGRRLSMESADMGRVEYAYNTLGQLEEETNSELRKKGQYIRYGYDEFGRQAKVTYPSLQAAVYEYGPPDTAVRNLAGRLVRLTDSSGTVEYEYGKLGETVKERRTLNKQTGTTQPKTAVFEYRSNYLGQMESIVYPDGEEVSYAYDYGGNVTGVKGRNRGVNFTYVDKIGYDEWGQRAYLRMGNGTETRYTYDEMRRWLSRIQTGQNNTVLQDITYSFDLVGNVLSYANKAGGYQTEQRYAYDGLYQLTGAEGESKNYQYGMQEYTAYYNQQYRFDDQGLGNMTLKSSSTASVPPRLLGDPLNYQLSYEYEPGFAHRASRIGEQYYRYDLNGSVVAVQDGPFKAAAERGSSVINDLGKGIYVAEGGWGLDESNSGTGGTANLLREYRWDDRNRMQYSNDGRYSVRYTYGEDGQRTGKWVTTNTGGESETLYFGKLWSWHYDGMANDYTGMNSKHIFLGETRIATKAVYADGSFIQSAEEERQFYYHSDHLSSAQLITDYKGQEYERFEYTPYGEVWIEKASTVSALDVPYRFTGKERDKETGLYYYGARYLDPKDSRWLSVDPAMGEYVPNPEQKADKLPGMGGVFNYVNLHAYHYAGNNPVKYVDPDGEVINIAAAGVGAVVGAGIGAASAYIAGGSTRDIIAAAAGGAVSGGIAGLTMGASLGVQIAGAGIAGMASYGTTQFIAGEPATLEGYAFNGAMGIASYGAGKLLNAGVSAVANKISQSTSSVASNATKASKTYQTYTKTNPITGEVYTGRTSGTGSAVENVARRDRYHHMNAKGFGPAQLDRSSSSYNAIRGREQLLIDTHGGAKSMGGTSGNRINGISTNNSNREIYKKAAEELIR